MSMHLVGIAGLGDPVVPIAPHRPGYVRYSLGQLTQAEVAALDAEFRRKAPYVIAGGAVILGALAYAGYRFIKWEEAQHGTPAPWR
jgi:hypothetical protein